MPPFVNPLIAQFEADPKKNPRGSIWQYSHKGLVVFYVPPSFVTFLVSFTIATAA